MILEVDMTTEDSSAKPISAAKAKILAFDAA